MRRYETVYITDADVSEEDRNLVFERTKELISKYNGFLVKFDEWGVKKLAYAIRKKSRGYYICMDYGGDGSLVEEMERSFRIDDKVLKFMTILLAEEVDLELLKEEQVTVGNDAVEEEEVVADSDRNQNAVDDSGAETGEKKSETIEEE